MVVATGGVEVGVVEVGEEVAGGAVCVAGAGRIVTLALPSESRIEVPLPSFARTEPSVKESDACPAVIASNLIVIILPALPVKPGLRAIPAKFMLAELPALENDGFFTQRVIIELPCRIEMTFNLPEGKEISPEAAFMAWSAEETITATLKVWPTYTV